MSVPNALIATPVRFAATSYVLRATINGITENLNFPASGSLTVGRDYYMVGDGQTDATPGSTNNGEGALLTMLQATINAHTQTSTATVTLDASFFVRVGFGDLLIGSLLWANASTTLDEAVFGFPNTDYGSAGTNTGTMIPHGLCRLGVPISVDGRPRQPVTRGIGRAMSGKVRVSNFGNPYKERELNLDLILQSAALTEYVDATNPTGSLEYAWLNTISLGRYFRLYEDEATTTDSTAYSLNTAADLEDALERAQEFRVRWRDTIRMIETEAAT